MKFNSRCRKKWFWAVQLFWPIQPKENVLDLAQRFFVLRFCSKQILPFWLNFGRLGKRKLCSTVLGSCMLGFFRLEPNWLFFDHLNTEYCALFLIDLTQAGYVTTGLDRRNTALDRATLIRAMFWLTWRKVVMFRTKRPNEICGRLQFDFI